MGYGGMGMSESQADSNYLRLDADNSPITGDISIAADLNLTTLTQNSIPFIGASCLVNEDTDNLVWDDTNKYLGIGIAAPTHRIHGLVDISTGTPRGYFFDMDYTGTNTGTGNYCVKTNFDVSTSSSPNNRVYTSMDSRITLQNAWNESTCTILGANYQATISAANSTTGNLIGQLNKLATANNRNNVTVTNAIATKASFSLGTNGASSVFTNVVGYYVEEAVLSSGSFTNFTGLYVEELLAGDTNWAVYTEGTTQSYFGGNVGFGDTAPHSKVEVAGSFATKLTEATGTTTLDETHQTLNCTANTFTVNLPTAVGISGRIYNIKNSGTGTITVDGDGTETIDGAATQTMATQYDFLTVQSDGSNWIILSH